MNGMPVIGSVQTIERAIRRFAVRAVIVAADAVPDLRLAELGERCERLGVSLLRLQITIDSCASAVEGAASPAAEQLRGLTLAVPAARSLPAGRVERWNAPATNVRFEEARVPGTSVPIVAGQRCPACSSYTLHRSHVKKLTERVQKKLTHKRLYRCQSCGWRGWTQELVVTMGESLPLPGQRKSLEPIDVILNRRPRSTRAS